MADGGKTGGERPVRLVVGAMSGTSADGVDAALVRVTGRGAGMSAELLRLAHRAYDRGLRAAIFAMRGAGAVRLAELARVGREVSLTYAACVNELLAGAGLSAGQVAAVAAHGQTLYHAPPDTVQWLDPALLAAETGCAVVSDFRRADCAAGGQGAPLVPYADWLLFRHPTKSRVLLNVGGIANLTYLPAGGGLGDVVAFDTGPGNCVSDWLCRELNPDGPGYDEGGGRAMRGRADMGVAAAVAGSAFAAAVPPKSTDGPAMIAAFARAAGWGEGAKPQAAAGRSSEDWLATACLATARCVARAFADHVRARDLEVLVTGGGARNRRLMEDLGGALAWWAPVVRPLDEQGGQRGAGREAVAFALLGAAALDGEPGNVPGATGARRRVVLGSVTPRP